MGSCGSSVGWGWARGGGFSSSFSSSEKETRIGVLSKRGEIEEYDTCAKDGSQSKKGTNTKLIA